MKSKEEKARDSGGARKIGKCVTFEYLCSHMSFPVLTYTYAVHETESYQTNPKRTLKIRTKKEQKKTRLLKN